MADRNLRNMNEQTNAPSSPEPSKRLLKIFEFLKTYLDLRSPHVRDIGQQMRTLWLEDLPQHAAIEFFRPDGNPEAAAEEDIDIILRITRPGLTHCPTPPATIADWLKPGWQEIDASAEVQPTRTVREKDEPAISERFEDRPQRPASLRKWLEERAEWQQKEQPARQVLAVFQTAYEWFGIHEREAEQIELLVGDGLLNCPDEAGAFNHPVLLQRLELEFYPEKGNPQFVFRKREQPPELYLEYLRVLPGANHQQIAKCADELKQTEFSPLGGEETDGFLRRLIYGILPGEGEMLAAHDQPPGDKPTVRRAPLIFMRQRRSGVENVFDMVREDIGKRTDFSAALMQIVGQPGGGPGSAHEPEVSPAAPGTGRRGHSVEQAGEQGTTGDRPPVGATRLRGGARPAGNRQDAHDCKPARPSAGAGKARARHGPHTESPARAPAKGRGTVAAAMHQRPAK